MTEDFVGYVGDPDLHDGEVIAVDSDGSDARVEVLSASGRRYEVTFSGVERISQVHAIGMRLYSLTEMRATPPVRRFVFVNWDEADEATLELEALELSCTPLPG